MITFRKAVPNDIEIIIELAIKSWIPTYDGINSKEQNEYMFNKWYSAEGLKNQMDDGQEFLFILEDQNHIGYASFSKINDHRFKLNKIYILPEFKGKGIGKKLLKEVEKIVLSKYCTELYLNVNRENSAVSFYKSQDYVIVREEDIPFDNYWMNDYLMCKQF